MTELKLIAAMGRQREVGAGNALMWHLPEDLAHFKASTMGQPVLMGRKTWDSLPERFRPLPGRRNLVMTRGADVAGAETVRSLDEALAVCAQEPVLWVIGGAALWALALPRASQLLLTEVDEAYPQADTFFPPLAPGWQAETDASWLHSRNGLAYRIRTWRQG
jgi:dihydrofolate reductase